jgi:protein-S-isoprenylcysteine O-methyltransferase Ste14
MFILVRAIKYATLLIGLLLVYIPARLLALSGIVRPSVIEAPQVAGMGFGAVGAGVALWCLIIFATIGRGTPAPFDSLRRLVIQGPYRLVRIPMYIGAGLALASAAIFYEPFSLLIYTGIFVLATHLFVVWYEEPALRQTFGQEYEAYCRNCNSTGRGFVVPDIFLKKQWTASGNGSA